MDAADRVVHSIPMQSGKSTSGRPLLTVIDDDEMLRESLPDLLRECGFETRVFSSGKEYLSSDCVKDTKCLILDIAMAGMTGLELQHKLNRCGQVIPIIFITAHRDEGI